MKSRCGLVSDAAPCQCHRRVPAAALGTSGEPRPLQFARRAISFQEARSLVRQVDEARWALEVHRTSRPSPSSIDFAQRLLDVIELPGGPMA